MDFTTIKVKMWDMPSVNGYRFTDYFRDGILNDAKRLEKVAVPFEDQLMIRAALLARKRGIIEETTMSNSAVASQLRNLIRNLPCKEVED